MDYDPAKRCDEVIAFLSELFEDLRLKRFDDVHSEPYFDQSTILKYRKMLRLRISATNLWIFVADFHLTDAELSSEVWKDVVRARALFCIRQTMIRHTATFDYLKGVDRKLQEMGRLK